MINDPVISIDSLKGEHFFAICRFHVIISMTQNTIYFLDSKMIGVAHKKKILNWYSTIRLTIFSPISFSTKLFLKLFSFLYPKINLLLFWQSKVVEIKVSWRDPWYNGLHQCLPLRRSAVGIPPEEKICSTSTLFIRGQQMVISNTTSFFVQRSYGPLNQTDFKWATT